MLNENCPAPTVFVVFGGAGDLTWRKLTPALYDLYCDHRLPDQFEIICIDRKAISIDKFRQHLHTGVGQFSRHGKADHKAWTDFAKHLDFVAADFSDTKAFSALPDRLADLDKSWDTQANHIFYQATPPSLVEIIIKQLGKAGVAKDRQHCRIVLEKPFGHDLDSARTLNAMLTKVFDESQIYRIDHYLGKETVQNILAFRFANALFEPIWDQRYIDHVQIAVAEQVGVEHRGSYYEHAGELRDMMQNHLMQILCLIAMEPQVSFTADEIRNKKVDVLHAIRPIPQQNIDLFAVRGQYGKGWLKGQQLPGYRDEPDVAPDSSTETFAALKLYVDNWRWQGVPFYLRTGKRLPARVSEVTIQFRSAPHQSFPTSAIGDWQPNRLTVHIQPNEGIVLGFQAKQPGPKLQLSPVNMRFTYNDAFKSVSPEAYETLLLDVMMDDATLFMRADQVEAAWSIVMPVLDAWQATAPNDFPNYQAGAWGPEAAEVLIARDGRNWVSPSIPEDGLDK